VVSEERHQGELRLPQEKVRIYILARELSMESKDLLTLCQQHGIDVKNQLSSIDPEVRDQVVQLVKRGSATATGAPPKPATLITPPKQIPVLSNKIRTLPPVQAKGSRTEAVPTSTATPAQTAPTAEAVVPAKETPSIAAQPSAAPPQVKAPEAPAKAPEPTALPPAARTTPPAPPAKTPEQPAKTPEPTNTPRPPQTPAATTPPTAPISPSHAGTTVRNLNTPRPGANAPRGDRNRMPPKPQPIRGIATPPPLKPAKTQEQKKQEQPAGPKKLSDIPVELTQLNRPITMQDITRQLQKAPPAAKPGDTTPVAPADEEEGEDDGKGGKGVKKKAGPLVGRDSRHKLRQNRQEQRKGEVIGKVKSVSDVAILLEDDPRERARSKHKLKHKHGKEQAKKSQDHRVFMSLPITVRALSESLGVRSGELLFKLMGLGAPPTITINSTVEQVMAETAAIEYGKELEIKRQADTETTALAASKQPDKPEDLMPRAPVVTIMGHVDHGKTSLLDKIRRSNVVATEAGGITQVIRAWRVEHGGRPITFLDTPGHEAFTQMRARGANVTDIAIIVVAADDGVMPQTEEAISHAKAAGVSIIVAINKVDMPSANIRRTEQQLYGLGLIPDTMGGDVPFVQTSAATGKGIDELLDMISVVAELKELKANPNKPATGTCLEAHKSEGEGVFATILVQGGTLRKGDVVLCGATFGRIRAMYNDLGQPIEEAGPSVPVRITGLDEVPNADDPFQVVADLSQAGEIAERRKDRLRESHLGGGRGPLTLENLIEKKIDELKIILKAEARGSIEAIKKELEKLHHEEVRVRVLHAAIGGITESDVQLALTSPDDTLILGFNAAPDDRARALAEERGIKIHQYNIIYNLTDDVRSALEGKLKPREEVIHLGRAMVREIFKISRVGTIAGCYVTQGTIERNAKVRVIRNGLVVYPPAERTVGLESLKRFKEDVREVREGFECGLKIAGYDDIKVDDVVEAYRIEQVQRTLS
jgi:translation initiation factor IF-2